MRPLIVHIAILSLATACGPKTTKNVAKADVVQAEKLSQIGTIPVASAPPEGEEGPTIEVRTEDINSDGLPDMYYVSERSELGAQLVRLELDLNWDGRIDVRTTFDPATGEIRTEEMDGDFDGHVDWVDYYGAGQVRTRSVVDTDYDDYYDLHITFTQITFDADGTVQFGTDEKGSIVRERDTDGDRRLERRETIDTNGTCVEIDDDGDGIYEESIGDGCPKPTTGGA